VCTVQVFISNSPDYSKLSSPVVPHKATEISVSLYSDSCLGENSCQFLLLGLMCRSDYEFNML
jgi:hypothetical protein